MQYNETVFSTAKSNSNPAWKKLNRPFNYFFRLFNLKLKVDFPVYFFDFLRQLGKNFSGLSLKRRGRS